MWLPLLRFFFPVPGNFIVPGQGGDLRSGFSACLLLTRSHNEPPRFRCRANFCRCKSAPTPVASVNPGTRPRRDHIWWDRRSDRQPACCSLFPSDLFRGICKVTGFHQGNQLERALVECSPIPPCFPSRWRNLLVNIVAVALVLGGAAIYWIRAKTYKIPFSTAKVIFSTPMILARLISKVGLWRRGGVQLQQEHGGLFIRARLQKSCKVTGNCQMQNFITFYGQVLTSAADSAALPIFTMRQLARI